MIYTIMPPAMPHVHAGVMTVELHIRPNHTLLTVPGEPRIMIGLAAAGEPHYSHSCKPIADRAQSHWGISPVFPHSQVFPQLGVHMHFMSSHGYRPHQLIGVPAMQVHGAHQQLHPDS